uniref:EF-hand domain-containing protein n=1 Tax=Alexandrium catenella TaxID=2925 RepID=A0A7S1LEC1_ALECA|eukprot:CAMPEP_0171223304 /NCGR_PEP_ID=MMETSP0790-20130122/35708_1 /TAXON_ID=2925 /ORGANISM="Alexandrium catenella, Strain OF101" /LENGTH=346 /DNA_ID=CAMNT_0011689273 /DNA_START=53 /DNA_END=1093 /DNA_ORIENTATION=+
MATAARDGRPIPLVASHWMVLSVILQGLLSSAEGASLRGSMRGSVLMQVETTTGGKIALDASEELEQLQESGNFFMDDIADDPSSGILDIAEDGSSQPEEAKAGRQSSSQLHAARLQRVGRLVDTDNDARISQEELQNFAQRLKDRQRHEQTLAAWRTVDFDKSYSVDLAELQAVHRNASEELLDQQARRFQAADADRSGRLEFAEFHAFVHPELDDSVLAAEVERQMLTFDVNGDGNIDFEEFVREGETHGKDFSQEAASEDFKLHDGNGDGHLSPHEFGRLLAGHDLLQESIRRAMEAGDSDGDGHIHVDDELPSRLHHLLESEFIEDYFFHKHADSPGRHSEL